MEDESNNTNSPTQQPSSSSGKNNMRQTRRAREEQEAKKRAAAAGGSSAIEASKTPQQTDRATIRPSRRQQKEVEKKRALAEGSGSGATTTTTTTNHQPDTASSRGEVQPADLDATGKSSTSTNQQHDSVVSTSGAMPIGSSTGVASVVDPYQAVSSNDLRLKEEGQEDRQLLSGAIELEAQAVEEGESEERIKDLERMVADLQQQKGDDIAVAVVATEEDKIVHEMEDHPNYKRQALCCLLLITVIAAIVGGIYGGGGDGGGGSVPTQSSSTSLSSSPILSPTSTPTTITPTSTPTTSTPSTTPTTSAPTTTPQQREAVQDISSHIFTVDSIEENGKYFLVPASEFPVQILDTNPDGSFYMHKTTLRIKNTNTNVTKGVMAQFLPETNQVRGYYNPAEYTREDDFWAGDVLEAIDYKSLLPGGLCPSRQEYGIISVNQALGWAVDSSNIRIGKFGVVGAYYKNFEYTVYLDEPVKTMWLDAVDIVAKYTTGGWPVDLTPRSDDPALRDFASPVSGELKIEFFDVSHLTLNGLTTVRDAGGLHLAFCK